MDLDSQFRTKNFNSVLSNLKSIQCTIFIYLGVILSWKMLIHIKMSTTISLHCTDRPRKRKKS